MSTSTPEKQREYYKKWILIPGNYEKVLAKNRKWYEIPKNKQRSEYRCSINVKIWRKNNPEKYRAQNKKFNSLGKKRSPDYMKIYRIKHLEELHLKAKIYSKTHRYKINEYIHKRIKTDVQFKLKRRLRVRMREALKNKKKENPIMYYIGCTTSELKTHIESKFQEGMDWNNWTYYGWHIDHIIPLSSFDMTSEEDLKIAWHYTNLQPLWAHENLLKSNKILCQKI